MSVDRKEAIEIICQAFVASAESRPEYDSGKKWETAPEDEKEDMRLLAAPVLDALMGRYKITEH